MAAVDRFKSAEAQHPQIKAEVKDEKWRRLGPRDYLTDAQITILTREHCLRPRPDLVIPFHFDVLHACSWLTLQNLVERARARKTMELLADRTRECVILAPISCRAGNDYEEHDHSTCNDDEARCPWVGNHWILVALDTRKAYQRSPAEEGLITFWDPLGATVKLDTLKVALRKRFPTFGIRNLNERVQTDGFSCGMWVIEATWRYYMWAVTQLVPGQLFSMSRKEHSYQVLLENASLNAQMFNRKYITNARDKAVDMLRDPNTKDSDVGHLIAEMYEPL